jgi:hypothetical protein
MPPERSRGALKIVAVTPTDGGVVVEWAADEPLVPWPNDPDDGPNDPRFTPLTLTDDLGTVYRRTAGSASFRPNAHGTVRFEPAPPSDASQLVARTNHHVATLHLRT